MTTLPACWHWNPLENRLCTDLIRGKVVGYCECGFPFSHPPYLKTGVDGGLTRRPSLTFRMHVYVHVLGTKQRKIHAVQATYATAEVRGFTTVVENVLSF